MKILHHLVNICKFILWALLIIIVYMLLTGVIKYGGVYTYIDYLNNKNWDEAWIKANILKPSTLSNFFYDSNIILPAKNLSGNNNFLGINNVTGTEIINEDTGGLDAYDPSLETDLNNSLGGSSGSEISGNVGAYGFKKIQ